MLTLCSRPEVCLVDRCMSSGSRRHLVPLRVGVCLRSLIYFPTRIRTNPCFLRELWLLALIGGLLTRVNYYPILNLEAGFFRIRVRKKK